MAHLGLLAQGTITERTIERNDANEPGKTRRYGPYYQWAFKNNGKTVNLSREQVKQYEQAIENHRRMEAILTEMREISLSILKQTTKGVVKRKPKE